MRSKLLDWFRGRARSYGQVVVVLCLNVPFLFLALSRYLGGVSWGSVGGVYAGLVFLGYYGAILLVAVTGLFLVTGAWPRLFTRAAGVLITLVLFYFLVDGVVYRLVKSHIDAFWLMYLATTFEGLGISAPQIVLCVAVLAGVAVLEWSLFRLAARIQAPARWVIGKAAACVLAYGVSQTLHVMAYGANDTRIAALTPQLPFYFPIVSHKHSEKYRDQLPIIHEASAGELGAETGAFRYPLREVACDPSAGRRPPNVVVLLLESWRADAFDAVVTPRMDAFSQRAARFLNHFSSGNSTPAGVFPIFYGIYPTYWTAVKANNAVIQNPVLIDALEANGYAFGIFANSHFERHKIKETVFRGIEVHETFEGETDDERDRDMTEQLLAFVRRQEAAGKPSFTFAFYKSTHYAYYYPSDMAPFQPAEKLSVFRASGSDDPAPVRNHYLNSVHYVDALIGGLLERMDADGLLDDTIVVITSDHGEELNDNRDNSWGHTGNFTKYQTRVPLLVYVPGRSPRQVTAVTSQIDIAPTLMQEALGCGGEVRDYSNGLSLFGPLPERRPVVVSSYNHHALILGDDVFVSMPLYMQRYKLDGSTENVGWPAGDLLDQAVTGMSLFYGGKDAADPRGERRASAAVRAGR
jgi:membrane-anchored protein YejM (alkaline phosphatase superfamily)